MVNRDDGAMFESKSGRTRSGKTFLTWGQKYIESWNPGIKRSQQTFFARYCHHSPSTLVNVVVPHLTLFSSSSAAGRAGR